MGKVRGWHVLGLLVVVGLIAFQNCSKGSGGGSGNSAAGGNVPALSLSTASVKEGTVASVKVTLNAASTTAQTFSWRTVANTAKEDTNYVPADGTITFEAGQTSITLEIATVNDGVETSNLNFKVQVGTFTSGSTDGYVSTTVTIVDESTAMTDASKVTALTQGFAHSCSVMEGAAYCWGSNGGGQLGTGVAVDNLTAVAVKNMTSGVTAISAGVYFTCAIKSSNVYCWGTNDAGQLGDGTQTNRATSTISVRGISGDATRIATGENFACAVSDNAVKCWGDNSYGQLGNDSLAGRFVATPARILTSGVTRVATGGRHACAIMDGALYCWGNNQYGQVGTGSGSTMQYKTPQKILNSGVTAVATGYRHTCAIQNGNLLCWGDNARSQVGDGTTTKRTSPVTLQPAGSFNRVAAAIDSSCATRTNGNLYCWGGNFYGQLGLSSSAIKFDRPELVSTLSKVSLIGTGLGYHFCAKTDTAIYSWGFNSDGQLGDGTQLDANTPNEI